MSQAGRGAVGFMAAALLACGNGREAVHPTTDAAACRTLVARIERVEHEDDVSNGSTDVPWIVKDVVARLEQAAKDIAAVPSTDESVRSFEQRYALHLHLRSAQVLRFGAFLEPLWAAAEAVMKSHAAEEAAAARCGNRTCAEYEAAHKQVTKDALTALVAKAALIANAQEPENVKSDHALTEQGDQLNEDLHALCGRPIPSKPSSR